MIYKHIIHNNNLIIDYNFDSKITLINTTNKIEGIFLEKNLINKKLTGFYKVKDKTNYSRLAFDKLCILPENCDLLKKDTVSN